MYPDVFRDSLTEEPMNVPDMHIYLSDIDVPYRISTPCQVPLRFLEEAERTMFNDTHKTSSSAVLTSYIQVDTKLTYRHTRVHTYASYTYTGIRDDIHISYPYNTKIDDASLMDTQ